MVVEVVVVVVIVVVIVETCKVFLESTTLNDESCCKVCFLFSL